MKFGSLALTLLFYMGNARLGAEPGPDDVEGLKKQAASAVQSGELARAVGLYRNILEAQPDWVEGWWNLATLQYDLDRYAQARDSFRRYVSLDSKSGAGWALLGLCEFEAGEYERAIQNLQQGQRLGLGANEQLVYVVRYHTALLLTRFQQFEAAIAILHEICLKHSENPKIIEALGLSVLRLPYLPSELSPEWREPVLLTGRASSYWSTNRLELAGQSYDLLVQRYPERPNVHYARAVFLLQYNPPEALPEFKKELEISPLQVAAHLQVAFEYLKRGEPESGLPYAEKSVSLEPGSFAARNALGRILLEIGKVARAIEELEKGTELAPDSPQMYFSLARAYTKAGRSEDAKRAREEFLRLDKLIKEKEGPVL
ncbi:MAG: tetratricopeptide repeat protein [Acidobacteriota bacterium]